MSDTVGPDKVKQTDKVMLSSLTEKYRLAKGYKQTISSLVSGGNTYTEGKDYILKTDKAGNTYIEYKIPQNLSLSTQSFVFPNGRDFQNKTLYPNGDLDTDYFFSFEKYANTVNFVNGGLEAKYVTVGVGALPPYTRTEYSNNIRFGTESSIAGDESYSPIICKVTIRPRKRTVIATSEQVGYGLFTGEGVILYGTPCDFIGIGGYGQGVVDGCPSPAGTGGALTQYNTFEGQSMIQYINSGSSPTIKVFRVQSTLGDTINISNVTRPVTNLRITTSSNHGLSADDVVYFLDNNTTWSQGTTTSISLNYEGFRVTSVIDATNFEIDAPEPASWVLNSGGTVQKVESCTAEYWDSGIPFPVDDIQFCIKLDGKMPSGGTLKFNFFYNVSGKWKKLGPTMNPPVGHITSVGDFNYQKLILGSYTGGHFNLSGSVGTFSSSMNTDNTDQHTIYRKLECEALKTGSLIPPGLINYSVPIPIFDEEES
jgi:hypothetical protein